jgi:spermidine synthase
MIKRLVFPAIWLGITATIGQILLLRELLVLFYGNELCIGLMLASWLFWVALGSFLGTKITAITNNRLQRLNPEIIRTTTFLFLLFLINLTLPASLLLFRGLRIILQVPPGEMFTFSQIGISILLCQLLFPFSLGLLFSFYCSLVDSAKEIGRIYLYESIGALLGGTVYTFYLVKSFDPFTIWAGLYALSVLAYYTYIREANPKSEIRNQQPLPSSLLPHPSIILFLCLIAVLLSITDIGPRLNKLSINWRWNKQELIESRDSVYGNLAVTNIGMQKNIYADGTLLFSIPNPIDDETFAHFSLLEHPNPFGKKILLLGGGGGSILREMLKYQPTKLVYLELDPLLIQLTRNYLPASDREAMLASPVQIINQDGRWYLKQTQDKFDIIIVNLTDPKTAMVNRYYTQEFFREVNQKLLPDGIFCIGLIGGEAYLGQELLNLNQAINQTMQSVFANVVIIPGDRNLYFASNEKNIISNDRGYLTIRWNSRAKNIPTQYFNEYMLEIVVQPDRVRFIKEQLAKVTTVPKNQDFKPTAYFYNLQLWLKQSKGFIKTLFSYLTKIQFYHCVIIIGILVVLAILFLKQKSDWQNRVPPIAVTGSTGLVGITLELVFVYAFQAIYGYVYQWIGLIIAIFMFGLAMGSWLGTKLIEKNIYKKLLLPELVILLLCLLIPIMLRIFKNQGFALFGLPGLTFIIGFLVGIEFPLCVVYFSNKSKIPINRDKSEILTRSTSPKSKISNQAGGIIYASDLIGSAIGALVAVVILIPLFGILMTVYLMAILKLGSVVIVLNSKSQI